MALPKDKIWPQDIVNELSKHANGRFMYTGPTNQYKPVAN